MNSSAVLDHTQADLAVRPANWKKYFFSVSAFLWIFLWAGIDTGPWVLRNRPESFIELIHYVRTILPFFVLITSIIVALQIERGVAGLLSGPVRYWMLYGLVSLFACLLSMHPWDAAYWAFLYLSVFAVLNAYIKGPDALNRAIYANYLSWIVTGAVLLSLLFIARNVLFVESPWGLTGYGIYGKMASVAEMPMSRSSGLARFAAIPGVIAFIYLWKGHFRRIIWAAVFLSSASLIYLMQSRGAILGFGFALSFVMLFFGRKTRVVGIILAILIGLLLFTNIIPQDFVQHQMERFMRGQDTDQFYSLTGRTRAWDHGWYEAMKSPIVGWGPQADRMLIGEHVHNTYLYALMTSGFVGVFFFAGGLLYAWLIFFKLLRAGFAERLGHKTFFIQIGGILAFFTVRSIPEVSGAMFGIDTMLLLPALGYLTVLNRTYDALSERNNQKKKIKIRF